MSSEFQMPAKKAIGRSLSNANHIGCREKTGVPTILLDGSLAEIPHTLRTLGGVLHREERAETLARFAEAMLALPVPHEPPPSVVYARGADGLNVAAPGTDVDRSVHPLGWHVRRAGRPGHVPPGQHRRDPRARPRHPDLLPTRDARRSRPRRGVADGARGARGARLHRPGLPFGWIEEPPSINRLLGLAWLGGSDPATLAALFNAVVYGHVLTPAATRCACSPALRSIATVRGPIMRFRAAAVPAARCRWRRMRRQLTVFAAASLTDAMKDVAALWATGRAPAAAACRSAPARRWRGRSSRARRPTCSPRPTRNGWTTWPSKNLIVAGHAQATCSATTSCWWCRPTSRSTSPSARASTSPALLGPNGRLATGDPAHVPVGIYAEQALRKLGLWDSVAPRLARTDDVRAALLLVERGEAPAGIVYGTDAAVSKGVMVAGMFPASSHDPVVYPFAVTKAGDTPEARALLTFLRRPAGARGVRRSAASRSNSLNLVAGGMGGGPADAGGGGARGRLRAAAGRADGLGAGALPLPRPARC